MNIEKHRRYSFQTIHPGDTTDKNRAPACIVVINSPYTTWYSRASHQEWYTNIKVIRHRLAFYQAILSYMIAVVGCK